MSAVKIHLKNCKAFGPKGLLTSIKTTFEASLKPEKRDPLPLDLAKSWRHEIAQHLADNSTVSISSMARIVTALSSSVASVTHGSGKLYDFSIGRTSLTQEFEEAGRLAEMKFKRVWEIHAANSKVGRACIVDFWSGRHAANVQYGGIVACGLDENWEWYSYPLTLSPLERGRHGAEFTYSFLKSTIGSFCFDLPVFVVTDNENKMIAAFDSRYFSTDENIAGRVGCTEHAFLVCLKDVLEKHPTPGVETLFNQLDVIETSFNGREHLLKLQFPDRSATRPWRWYYLRLQAHCENYHLYLESDVPSITDNIPSLTLIKNMLKIATLAKEFFDKVEIDAPTSHLSLINYLSTDFELFDIQINCALLWI